MAIKQWILIRKDLKTRRGKEAAQASHASMAAILNLNFSKDKNLLSIRIPDKYSEWFHNHFTKICLYIDSEEELLSIYHQAQKRGLICALIQDSGKTEFKGIPTYTAVAIGPAHEEEVKDLTEHLKLM